VCASWDGDGLSGETLSYDLGNDMNNRFDRSIAQEQLLGELSANRRSIIDVPDPVVNRKPQTVYPIPPTVQQVIDSKADCTLVSEIYDQLDTIWVNVKNFGATGDGVTDDTDAINDAISTLTGGEILLFPEGTYVISTALDTITTSVWIWGAGIGRTIIDATALSAGPALAVEGTLTLETTVSSAISEGDYDVALVDASNLSTNDFFGIRRKESTLTGTITFTNGSTAVSADGDGDFANEIAAGDWIAPSGTYSWSQVASITDADNLILELNFTGSTVTDTVDSSLLNNSDTLWFREDATFGFANKSEFMQVDSKTGDTVHLTRPAYDGYLGNSLSEVYVFNGVETTWEGFEIQLAADIEGAHIHNALHVRIRDVKITGAYDRGLELRHCVDSVIDGYVNYDTWTSGSGTSYGLKISGCQDTRISNCHCLDGRHALDTGTAVALSWMVRNTVVTNSHFAGLMYGISNHENNQYYSISNCQVWGGALFSGDDISVVGNQFFGLNHTENQGHGTAVYLARFKTMNILVEDNIITETVNIGSTARSLLRLYNLGEANDGICVIRNNTFNMKSFTGYSIKVYLASDTIHEALIIDGNEIYGESDLNDDPMVEIQALGGDDGGTIRNASFSNNVMNHASLYWKGNGEHLRIAGNKIYQSGRRGLFVFADDSGNGVEYLDVRDNYVFEADGAGIAINGDENSSLTRAIILNNIVMNSNRHGTFGTSTADRSGLQIRYLKEADVRGNVFRDIDGSPTQTYGIYSYNSVDNLWLEDNDLRGNVTGPVFFEATITFRYAQNNRPHNVDVTLGAAATTFDVWSDHVTLTGYGGGNTISTITGGEAGSYLALQFVDANITITDTDGHTTDTIDLARPFLSSDDATLVLRHDGTSWYEVSRSQELEIATVAAATYTALASDSIIHVTYTPTGVVTITLPTALTNTTQPPILVKDAGGNAGTNNITIATQGAETIDGGATAVISVNYNSIWLYSDGTNWFTY